MFNVSTIQPTGSPSVPAAAKPPKGPTDVGFMLQDPATEGATVDTIKLNLSGTAKPASDNYALTVAVAPKQDGSMVFDPKSDQKQFLAMTILANLQRGHDIFIKYCDNVPPNWATGDKKLDIYPDDGEDFNAYYNREEFQGVKPGVHFFHGKDPKTKETVYSGMSGEVTGHEGGPGHALLDRFRPGYFSTWSTDPAAFHESFGDVSSMLCMLSDDKLQDQVIAQTGGDLSKHNVISDTGEQLGDAINHYVEAQGGPANYTGGKWVRSAINDLTWVDPSTLPENPTNPGDLTSEPHDWSRLWTGSVYSILTDMVKQNIAAGEAPKAALAGATEDMLKIYGKMISTTSPEGDFTYKDMANAMVKADEQTGGKWGATITKVMTDRKILSPETSMVESEVPQGTRTVAAEFSGNEPQFDGTGLDALGKFNVETLQSGQHASFAGDVAVTGKLANDLARLAKQGKILFTTPDQKLSEKDLINPQTHEPYTGVVKWVDGQATLHRLKMA